MYLDSFVTSNDSFTFSNGYYILLALINSRQLVNKYAFGITATFKSTGAAVLLVNPDNSIRIVGVAVEESINTNTNQPLPITTTKNFATWTNEFIDCWDATGRFSINQSGCLKHFALDYVLKTGVNLVGSKNLVKDTKVQANVTLNYSVLSALKSAALSLNMTSSAPQGNDVAADGIASSAFEFKSALFVLVFVANFIL